MTIAQGKLPKTKAGTSTYLFRLFENNAPPRLIKAFVLGFVGHNAAPTLLIIEI